MLSGLFYLLISYSLFCVYAWLCLWVYAPTGVVVEDNFRMGFVLLPLYGLQALNSDHQTLVGPHTWF